MFDNIKGIIVQIMGDTSGLDAALKRTQKKLTKTGDAIAGIGKSMTKAFTVPIVAAATVAVSKFAEVDKTMTLVNATMGNSTEEAQLLNRAMKEAAANSTYGMSDAATAMLNFARAGLSAEEAANTIAPAMNLAAGEGGDLDTVSAGLIATINGFHGSFDDAARYADVFANACNNSALDVNSLSEAMSIAAPIFATAGYSVEDAALYMGVMANNGIDANKAATSLKTGMARLVKPAKDGATWMERLGINIVNADGSMKDSVTVQKELNEAFAGLSESEQIAAASAIFGKNQMAPWLALINTAPEDVNALSEALQTEGTTAEMANAMMGGFGGSLEKLKSSIDVAAVSFGEALAPVISKVAEAIQSVVTWFNSLDAEQQQTIATIALVVAAIGPLLIIIGSVISAIGTLTPVIAALAGPIGIIIVSISTIVGIITTLWNTNEEFRNSIIGIWEEIKTAWNECVTGIKEALAELGINFESSGSLIKGIWTEFCNMFAPAIKGAFEIVKNIIKTVLDAIRGIVQTVVKLIQGDWKGAWEAMKQTASNLVNNIWNTIKSVFTTIWNYVSGIVGRLKNIFNFNWSLPKIKLPHFSVSDGRTVLGVTLPKISVEWYRKAYDNPYLFTSPTVVGGRGFGDGGGSGEIVYGRDQLMRDIATASQGDITINVYASDGMDVNALADKIQYRLAQVQKQRMSAYA